MAIHSFQNHRGKAQLTLNGEPLSDSVTLISLSLVDKRGLEPDTLTIVLDDSHDSLPLPQKKAVITLLLGWDHANLIDKGSFTVSAVRHSGTPDTISITAQSADLLSGFKEPKKKSWSNITLGSIVSEIALTHSLKAIVSDDLSNITLAHIDQNDESDANLLTRLSDDYDAIAQVKSGHLIFMPKGKATSATGEALEQIVIARSKGDSHDFSQNDEASNITGVQAYWRDIHHAKRQVVKVGDDGNRRHLKNAYPNQKEALAAANAKWQAITRGVYKFNAHLAKGLPELMVESPVTLTGYKSEINAINWVGEQITHTLDSSGLTSSLQLEELK